MEKLKQRIPGKHASKQEWRNYTTNLEQAFDETFDRTQGILAITEEEANKLADFFYITKLLLDCKDAAIHISKKDWEALEARLLTIPPKA